MGPGCWALATAPQRGAAGELGAPSTRRPAPTWKRSAMEMDPHLRAFCRNISPPCRQAGRSEGSGGDGCEQRWALHSPSARTPQPCRLPTAPSTHRGLLAQHRLKGAQADVEVGRVGELGQPRAQRVAGAGHPQRDGLTVQRGRVAHQLVRNPGGRVRGACVGGCVRWLLAWRAAACSQHPLLELCTRALAPLDHAPSPGHHLHLLGVVEPAGGAAARSWVQATK